MRTPNARCCGSLVLMVGLIVALLPRPGAAAGPSGRSTEAPAPAGTPGAVPDSTRWAADEAWLKTVWSQIDTLVRQEDFDLQETVVAGGVRGAEGADPVISQYYYYRGTRYYASEELVGKVIERLTRQRMSRRPGNLELARLRYLSGLCYDVLGRHEEARRYYAQVAGSHPGSQYAPRARERLTQLEGGE